MTTVLVITDDLGFQAYLADSLSQAGLVVIPAKTPANAAKLLPRLKRAVDVVLFNPSLAGAREFIQTLSRSQQYLHALPIPNQPYEISGPEWARRIRKTLHFSATA